MFLVNVMRRSTGQPVLGNGDGQGYYRYQTFRNFSRFVLNNPDHTLCRTVNSEKYYIEVYRCTESNKFADESTMPLVYSSEN